VWIAESARYAENQSPYRAAIFIAASLQSHFIETLTADQRALLVRQLQNTDYGQIANALESAVKDEISEFPDGLTFEAIVIAISIFMARALLEDGKIEQSEFEMFDSEVFGALAGKSPDQRAHERLSTLFEESRRKSQ
jgi:hypothetical protein